MFVYAAILFFIGTCLGSFVNALIWRVREQSKTSSHKKSANLSVINGRSMCVHCKHELNVLDLIPVISWLALKGRCRYCKKPIDDNPLVELVSGLLFGLSYLAWPNLNSDGQSLLLITWLLSSVGLLALATYDIKWRLLPNRILYPTLLVALVGRLGYIGLYSSSKGHDLIALLFSITVASGIFWVIFQLSSGRWIGFGDVRLGLVTGTLLATPGKALLMIFLSSLIGTLAVMPSLLSSKRSVNSKVPYGPYLIVATAIGVLYGQQIINWYTAQFRILSLSYKRL